MRILVTGGAGFIGRWVVKSLLDEDYKVTVLDDLSNGSMDNLAAFEGLFDFIFGDIKDKRLLASVFKEKYDICIHLAASINVQESIDMPSKTFENDVIGTFNLLEEARKQGMKFVFMSTCMVYATTEDNKLIDEDHPTLPLSPYAACKLAGEELCLSYYYAYGLPVVVLRVFNTYGPYQKKTGEGGVISIFINRALRGEDLLVYGDGKQTRDFLYVEDCADFIKRSALSKQAEGKIINAGSGSDISINDLAYLICPEPKRIKHVPHIHPQSEIKRLICDTGRAYQLLNWKPKITLAEGLRLTEEWIRGCK